MRELYSKIKWHFFIQIRCIDKTINCRLINAVKLISSKYLHRIEPRRQLKSVLSDGKQFPIFDTILIKMPILVGKYYIKLCLVIQGDLETCNTDYLD